jgi:hypothetical protein
MRIREISVTPDHIFLAKEKESGKISADDEK